MAMCNYICLLWPSLENSTCLLDVDKYHCLILNSTYKLILTALAMNSLIVLNLRLFDSLYFTTT